MAAIIQRICSEQPTNLIVFPELAVSGYECGLNFTRLAERVPGHAVSYLAGKAAEFSVYVAFGMPVKEKVESILFNAAVVIGPDGELLGDYRKLHLRGEERLAFRPGYRLPVFETEFGQLGVMIGWDLAFPEVARSLTLDGADLIVACAAWEAIASGGVAGLHRGAGLRERGLRRRGQPRGRGTELHASAASRCWSARVATVHTALDEAIEGYAVATVDLDEIRKVREESQLLQCRQPAAYRALVRKY